MTTMTMALGYVMTKTTGYDTDVCDNNVFCDDKVFLPIV